METQLSITLYRWGKSRLHVEVPYGERRDSFCDWVVRALRLRGEPHSSGLVASLVTTDFVKKPMAVLAKSSKYNVFDQLPADGWLGQYNRKHRKENEIAAFPRLKLSGVSVKSLIAGS